MDIHAKPINIPPYRCMHASYTHTGIYNVYANFHGASITCIHPNTQTDAIVRVLLICK